MRPKIKHMLLTPWMTPGRHSATKIAPITPEVERVWSG